MKKIPACCAITAMIITATCWTLSTTTALANKKYSSIVIQPDTNEVLHVRHADSARYPASLTKMMTLCLAFDALSSGRLKMDQRLYVSRHAENARPSELGLKYGETITVRDTINSIITKSANDSAIVIAEALAGSERAFAQQMTRKARSIGMTRTRFRNASGWHDRRQYSTARDLAKLAEHLFEHHSRYYHLFGQDQFVYKDVEYRNTNRLLGSYYGTDGIKTGYTSKSGYNLVASAKRDGERVIAVVMGGKSGKTRNKHMIKLLDAAFNELKKRPNRQELLAEVSAAPSRIRSSSSRREIPSAANGKSVQIVAVKSDVAKTTSTTGSSSLRGRVVSRRDQKPTATTKQLATITPLNKPIPTSEFPPSAVKKVSAKKTSTQKWMIQVGAFLDKEVAQQTLNQVLQASRHQLHKKQMRITRIELEGQTIYRARFKNLTKKNASQACTTLRKKGFSCYSVRESTNSS